MELAEWLLARIAEDERWARAAQDERAPQSGERWRWEFTGGRDARAGDGVTDEPVDLDACDGLGFVGEAPGVDLSPVSLRSVDQYPYGSLPGAGPHFVLYEVEELRPGVARHIARHDPARVLADCAVHRAIVAECQRWLATFERTDVYGGWPDITSKQHAEVILELLAQPYAAHPDFQPEWSWAPTE